MVLPPEFEAKLKLHYRSTSIESDMVGTHAQVSFRSAYTGSTVIDSNGDGHLQMEEVVQALLPNTEQNDKFLTALGFEKIDMNTLQ